VFTIVEADFVKSDFPFAGKSRFEKIIGNLPFNAASATFGFSATPRSDLDDCDDVSAQVAERIRAKPVILNTLPLSVYAALYFDIDLHFRVAAGSFHPKPKVDAEVLRFRPRENLPLQS